MPLKPHTLVVADETLIEAVKKAQSLPDFNIVEYKKSHRRSCLDGEGSGVSDDEYNGAFKVVDTSTTDSGFKFRVVDGESYDEEAGTCDTMWARKGNGSVYPVKLWNSGTLMSYKHQPIWYVYAVYWWNGEYGKVNINYFSNRLKDRDTLKFKLLGIVEFETVDGKTTMSITQVYKDDNDLYFEDTDIQNKPFIVNNIFLDPFNKIPHQINDTNIIPSQVKVKGGLVYVGTHIEKFEDTYFGSGYGVDGYIYVSVKANESSSGSSVTYESKIMVDNILVGSSGEWICALANISKEHEITQMAIGNLTVTDRWV